MMGIATSFIQRVQKLSGLFTGTVTVVLFMQCADTGLSGGFGSETTNGRVTGTALLPDGKPSVGARVAVRRADFVDPSFSRESSTTAKIAGDAQTDAAGTFIVDSLDTGSYIVEINDGTALAVQQGCDITTGQNTAVLEHATLQPYGTIIGWVDPATLGSDAYVQSVGVDRRVPIDSGGNYILDDLPYGTIRLRVVTDSLSTAQVMTQTVVVQAGGTTVVAPSGYEKSSRVGLNTTAAGAGILDAPVTGFPVLVRLTSMNFDFAGAASDGRDIAFTKSNGMPMTHEIERWDATAGKAEVWVLVDTVYANDSSQHFFMYWGNPDAAAGSNGTAVFDTGNSFRGVWHLGENGDTLHDASVNRYNAGRHGNQSTIEGAIGYAQSYVDSGDFSDMGNVLNPLASDFTVSAWIKRADTGGTSTIIGKTNGDTILPANYGWLLALNADYLRVYVASGAGGSLWGDEGTYWSESSVKITDLVNWHHVSVTIDKSLNTNCRLFIDGTDVTKSRNGDITSVGIVTNTIPVRIGCEADNDYPGRGYIDEARVSFTARAPEWIRLCYMNQRPDDRLVVFK
jgi:hypothetical protein